MCIRDRVEIEGNRLGLGTNLFSAEQTLTERFGIEKEEKELNKQSELMTQLADIDESSEVLLVREGKIPTGEVVIGEYQRQTGTTVSYTHLDVYKRQSYWYIPFVVQRWHMHGKPQAWLGHWRI